MGKEYKIKRLNAKILLLSLILCKVIYSQMDSTSNNERSNIIQSKKNSWIEINNIRDTNIVDFFRYNKRFNLKKKDEIRLINQKNDKIGNKHFYFQQYYNGIMVLGCGYSLHEKNGCLISGNGKIVENLNFDFSKIKDWVGDSIYRNSENFIHDIISGLSTMGIKIINIPEEIEKMSQNRDIRKQSKCSAKTLRRIMCLILNKIWNSKDYCIM